MTDNEKTSRNPTNTVVIALLLLLIAHAAYSEWRRHASSVAPEPPAFSVDQVGDLQYVMRVNQSIYYCVGNKCTTIQDVSRALARAAREAGATAEPEATE